MDLLQKSKEWVENASFVVHFLSLLSGQLYYEQLPFGALLWKIRESP